MEDKQVNRCSMKPILSHMESEHLCYLQNIHNYNVIYMLHSMNTDIGLRYNANRASFLTFLAHTREIFKNKRKIKSKQLKKMTLLITKLENTAIELQNSSTELYTFLNNIIQAKDTIDPENMFADTFALYQKLEKIAHDNFITAKSTLATLETRDIYVITPDIVTLVMPYKTECEMQTIAAYLKANPSTSTG